MRKDGWRGEVCVGEGFQALSVKEDIIQVPQKPPLLSPPPASPTLLPLPATPASLHRLTQHWLSSSQCLNSPLFSVFLPLGSSFALSPLFFSVDFALALNFPWVLDSFSLYLSLSIFLSLSSFPSALYRTVFLPFTPRPLVLPPVLCFLSLHSLASHSVHLEERERKKQDESV